jgi:hypothetical protein
MNDTAPDVSEYVRNRYAAMSPETRFLIGIRMFDTARKLVEASIASDLTEFVRSDTWHRILLRSIAPA